MSEEIKEIRDGSFLCVNEEGKAYWGVPEGYPYKEKGLVIRSISELSWSENTGFKKNEYPYKADINSDVFNTFDTIPDIDQNSQIQIVVDDIVYSNITIRYANAAGAYEIEVYSKECPVSILTVNAYMADTVTVQCFSKSTDITSIKVIDLDRDFIKPMPSNYIEFASTTPGSNKKFKITVDDSGTISATEINI